MYTYMVSAHATAAVTVRALVKYTCTYCCAFMRATNSRAAAAAVKLGEENSHFVNSREAHQTEK